MVSDVFLKKPLTAIVIAIVIVMLGVLSMQQLPVSQYPDITPPTVFVSATYPGADAQTVEQTVTTPLEFQINGSPGMMYFQSSSNKDGTSIIQITYEPGTNIDIAAVDVQNRANIALPTLPEEVQRLGVTVRKRNPDILMLVAVYSPENTHSHAFIDNYANLHIQEALLRVNGVGDISVRADPFSMRIWLRPDLMAKMQVTASDVVAALEDQNLLVSGGSIGLPPQRKDQAFEYTVMTNSMLNTVPGFENVVIRSNPATGATIYLKDIARVELGQYSYGNSYVDGKEASFLMIYQTPGSNALAVAKAVYAEMENLKKEFPAGIDYVVPFEAVSIVEASTKEIVRTLLIALLLVVLVVFIFLQDWRAALIPLLAIPVSIIGTFIFFRFLGFSINTLTLFGFVLAIGIVVDDAIIVVEAARKNIETDKSTPREATRKAMASLSAPVIAIALILAAVFVPVGFISGIVGKLYQQFAVTIAVSVIISAFIALSLTPALCSLLLRPAEKKEQRGWLSRFFDKFNANFNRVNRKYVSGVQYAIRKAPFIVGGLVVLTLIALMLFTSKPTGFIPTEDDGRFFITYQLPESASTTRSLEVLDSLMNNLSRNPEIQHVAGISGINIISGTRKSNTGSVFCMLRPWNERKKKSRHIEAVTADIQEQFPQIDGATAQVVLPPTISGFGSTGGFNFILEQKSGNDDSKTFRRNLTAFLEEVNQQPEIGSAYSFFTASAPGYQLTVDREKAKRMGLSLSDVYTTLQTYLSGKYVNDFIVYERSYKVMVEADTMYRQDISNLNYYYVRNESGGMVPLGSIISYELTETPASITHYNMFRSAEINGSPAPGYSSGDALKVLSATASESLPVGYGYEFSGLSLQEVQSDSTTWLIFGLSLIFVFLFLVALYESWSLPFSVLFAIPLGAFGAIVTLTLIPHLSNNIYAQIGLLTLTGLAAKNAILIVEYAKEQINKGIPLQDAVLKAAQLRLRPILMTSVAFILAALPLALATGAGAISRQTIGWTVIGGMLAATLLAIFTVPVLFLLLTRLANRLTGTHKK